jgi:hypothetical protein
MLQTALRALGFDLDREGSKLIGHARDQFEALSARTIRDLKSSGRQVAESTILMSVGAVFAVATVGLAMALLYMFLNQRYGTYVALGAVAGIAALLAAFVLAAGCQRATHVDLALSEPIVPVASTEEPYVAPTPPPVRPSAYLATLIPPPAPGAPLTEILLHQAKTRGAEAADEAIGQAEKVIREGSRPALVTTLALTALVGLYFGRQKRF